MWHELVPNEIWSYDNYLSSQNFVKLKDYFNSDQSYEMTPGEWIRDCFRKSKVNPTLYSYRVHPSSINQDRALLDSIFDPIESHVGQDCPRENLNQLQLFLKSFSGQSFYDLHCEPQWRYGEYAFLLFVDDCEEGGELVFPDPVGLDNYLKANESQRKHYLENKQILEKAGESVRVVGPCEITPQRNKAVLFRTGSSHFVRPPKGNDSVTRRTLASWPFATQELVDDLDIHCKIKQHFTPGS